MIFKFMHNNIPIKFKFPDSEDFLSQQIIQHESFYESRYLSFIEKYHNQLIRRKDGVVLDIGAHMGNHSIFFSKILNKKVYAFEPQLDIYNCLCKNIQLNQVSPLVTPKNIALSAKEEILNVVKKYDNMCGSTQWWYNNRKSKYTQQIQSIPLDLLFKRRIDFIKIDVEGMEMEVLKGARNIIQQYCPVIMIEVTDIDGEGHFPNKEKFDSWVKRYNYEKIGKKYFNRNTHLLVRKGLINIPEEIQEEEEEHD